jgi:hypothetical protein
MFIMEGQQADAEIRENAELDGLLGNLTKEGYKPILRSMHGTTCSVAGVDTHAVALDAILRGRGVYRHLPPDERRAVLPGDLLFKESRAYILQPISKRIQVWEVRPHSVISELPIFCEAVAIAARTGLDGRRVRGMDFTWKAIKGRSVQSSPFRSRFYREEKLETAAAAYTAEESRAAQMLVSSQTRNFLLRLAQVGKARSIDTASEVNEGLTKPLLELGLIRREFLVICRLDSHTICALQDREEIDSSRGTSFICTACSRPFKDELVQEIFALTDLGKRLLTGSRWMTIWITDLLITSGIEQDQIAWNPAAGEDELDIMTDALGPRVFFELKDREFGLGDAYPFAYRVTRYGGTFGVVVSMDCVADEAKKFFAEQRPNMGARIETLEGPEIIKSGIVSLVDRVSRTGVTQLMGEFDDAWMFILVPILQAWMEQVAAKGSV